jgi:putative N-acetylmannosamine-6-phosphate epimerase
MFEKGIIVSIQNYSLHTAQELAIEAIKGGAVGIRTDQPLKVDVPVIGLKKIKEYRYYITPTRMSINEVSRWTDTIAIDSRKGNENLSLLYAHCHLNELNIIADVENIEDVKNVLNICSEQKIAKPKYFATTFGICDNKLVNEITKITNIPVIAEGGYDNFVNVSNARKAGANNICIGSAISDVKKLTEKFSGYYKGSDE